MIYDIDYHIDRDYVLYESEKVQYSSFVDPKSKNVLDFWKICHDVGPYTQAITNDLCKILDVHIKPRYYIQEVGSTIPWHVDRGTKCAINVVLSTDRDPIEFRDRSYHYSTALIDTTKEHRVSAVTEPRVLFKMSIFDKSFGDCRDAYIEYQRRTP